MSHADYPLGPREDRWGEDEDLVERALHGERQALEDLLRRHQGWVYNLAVRMLYEPEDAADATQEILVKCVTHLSTFRGESAFRTWLYRIAMHHILNERRRRARRPQQISFESFAATMRSYPDTPLPEVGVPAELLVREAMTGCTLAMLLCLSDTQRAVYVLGQIFGVSDRVGADILECSPAAFRKRLERARRDLHAFMDGQCGLIDPDNPCRCPKKTRAFIRHGHVDPDRMLFSPERIERLSEKIPAAMARIDTAQCAHTQLFRAHAFLSAPSDWAALLSPLFQATLDELT